MSLATPPNGGLTDATQKSIYRACDPSARKCPESDWPLWSLARSRWRLQASLVLFCSSRHWERFFLRYGHPLLPFCTTRARARAPLCHGWMDRTSNDCRLLYEIIGPRGRVRAIQAPDSDDRIESGSRERDREERGKGGHRRCGPQSCSPYTTSEYIVSGNIYIVVPGEKREKRGWWSDTPCNGERWFTRLDDPKATRPFAWYQRHFRNQRARFARPFDAVRLVSRFIKDLLDILLRNCDVR